MRNINIIFEDSEFEKIEEKKKKSKLSWHDFILKLIRGEK